MKKLSAICIAFLMIITSITPLYASANTWESMDMDIYIHADGSATIQETWSMVIREGTENFRRFEDIGDAYIIDFSVRDEIGFYTSVQNWDINASREQKANRFGIVEGSNYIELCYGLGDYGERRYTMQYTIVNFVAQYADTQGINWRFVTNDMSPKPERVNITIQSDVALNDNTADIYAFGFEGFIHFREYGILVSNEENNRLGRVNYVDIFIGLEDNYFTGANNIHQNRTYEDMLDSVLQGSNYRDNESNPLYIIILVVALFGIAVIGLIFTFIYMQRKKKYFPKTITFNDNEELEKKVDVDPFRDIPCQKDVFRFYYIAKVAELAKDEDLKSGLLSAVLLNWVRNGEIEFIKTKGNMLNRKKYEIDFSRSVTCRNDLEEKMLGFIRSATNKNQILETKKFERWCSKNFSKLDAWFSEVDMYAKKLLIEDGSMLSQSSETKFLFFNIPNKQVVYTAKFREELYQVTGLKNFLLEFSSIEEKQVQEVRLWEDYLIFASVLGLAENVENELGRLYPEFNQYSYLDYTYTSIATRYFVYSSIRSSARARSMSEMRSSGSGGSSSFGGGGGGFGGGGGGSR